MTLKKAAHCHGISCRRCVGPSRCTRARSSPGSATTRGSATGSGCPARGVTWSPRGSRSRGATAWISGFHYRKGYGQAAVPADAGRHHHRQAGGLPRRDLRSGGSASAHLLPHGGGILQRGGGCGWWRRTSCGWSTRSSPAPCSTPAGCGASRSPVRGSAVVASDRIGLVPFQTSGVAHIYWFSFKRLVQPGVLDLGVRVRAGSSSAQWCAPASRASCRARPGLRPALPDPVEPLLRGAGHPVRPTDRVHPGS